MLIQVDYITMIVSKKLHIFQTHHVIVSATINYKFVVKLLLHTNEVSFYMALKVVGCHG
jgi:hypothetical protein